MGDFNQLERIFTDPDEDMQAPDPPEVSQISDAPDVDEAPDPTKDGDEAEGNKEQSGQGSMLRVERQLEQLNMSVARLLQIFDS